MLLESPRSVILDLAVNREVKARVSGEACGLVEKTFRHISS